MRHVPALLAALALAVPAAHQAHHHAAGLALFSFAVSAFRTRLG